MKCAENRKNIPLKDVFLFWTKVKKRSNTEVLDNYMALMKKQGLKILDSMIPDLCRYDKELSSGPAPISDVHSFPAGRTA